MRQLAVLAAILCAVLLQVFLSRQPRRWPGLVLPVLAFLFGLLYPLNLIAPPDFNGGFALQMLMVWLLGNIPTILFLAIYFSSRKRNR